MNPLHVQTMLTRNLRTLDVIPANTELFERLYRSVIGTRAKFYAYDRKLGNIRAVEKCLPNIAEGVLFVASTLTPMPIIMPEGILFDTVFLFVFRPRSNPQRAVEILEHELLGFRVRWIPVRSVLEQ